MKLVSTAASKKWKSCLSSLERAEPTVIKHLLPAEQLYQTVQDIGYKFRSRIFTPVVTTWLWFKQRLQPGTACKKTVSQAFTRGLVEQDQVISTDNTAYCRARVRLPEKLIERTALHTARQADDEADYQAFGRPVYLVDGTTAKMADTEQNQQEYPQPKSQKQGCGFPAIRMVGMFSLSSGVLRDMAMGPLAKSELALFHTLWPTLPRKAIVVADRYYGCYMELALLPQHGVDAVMRVNASRKVDFRRSHKRLGKNDAIFKWRRPSSCTWLSREERLAAPETQLVRVIKYKIRIKGIQPKTVLLATTLLDPEAYPAKDLAYLYGRRWQVEVNIRDIKTTMRMEFINVQSPAMVRKEVWMHMLCYNMTRSVMQQACKQAGASMAEMSFKGSLGIITSMAAALGTRVLTVVLYEQMLEGIARDRLKKRPHRSEPRAVKRRKKDYPMLTSKRRPKVRPSEVLVT